MADLLRQPAYEPLWRAARRRVEANGLSLDGTPLIMKGLTPEEADAISCLLGVRRPSNGVLRVSLRALDGALRSSVVGGGLLDVLTELGGPLVDRQAARQQTTADRQQTWRDLTCHPAVAADQRLVAWLDHLQATGTARRLSGANEARAVSSALDVLVLLGDGAPRARHRLAVLAAKVTGDAHGLDRGRAVGTLAVHALSWLTDQCFPQDAADWRRAWSDAGVACDDLSCDVLVLNLPGWPAEPLRLTLRQVSAWSVPRVNAPVFVCENPAVLAAAVDQFGESSPTMVCIDGMPSTAGLVVLDGLAAAGRSVGYHGDFDWRGLAIAGVLARKVTATRPWRFSAADYREAIARGVGAVPLSGRPTPSPWDADLAATMEAAGVAIYEEQVIDMLMDDLASTVR